MTPEPRLVRLLQTGYVLEAIVEGRSDQHRYVLGGSPEHDLVRELLADAHSESQCHRQRLDELLVDLGAEPVPSRVTRLVEAEYDSPHATVEAILTDQLCSELSAYRFYDAVLDTVTEPSADAVPATAVAALEEIRAEEREGVSEVLALAGSLDVSTPVTARRIRT
ncbi:MAG: ferritin-like domain-containing protein [Halobaculum sp.]